MTDLTTKMTESERAALVRHETIIAKGRQTFVEVGEALLAIRDRRLFRDEFETFDAYCKEKWAFARAYADRLISAATTVALLNAENGENGVFDHANGENTPRGVTSLPSSEKQARPLATLDTPAEKAEAWRDAVNGSANGHPTAKAVGKSVQKVKAKRTPRAEPERKPKPKAESPATDKAGCPLPPSLVEVFADVPLFRSLQYEITRLYKVLKELSERKSGFWAGRHMQTLTGHVKQFHSDVRFAIPHAVCPHCGGRKCNACKQAGFITKRQYDGLPAEFKRKAIKPKGAA